MMEENNELFLAGGDAIVYLPNQNTKNVRQHFFEAIHLVRIF